MFQKATRTSREYWKKLWVLAKNDAKQRLQMDNIKVSDLSQELNSALSNAHFETTECITNKSKEKEYVKKTNHLIEKYQNLTKGKNADNKV